MNLEIHDQRHLDAAEGWLGLGDWLEANEELERITPKWRAHPDVLAVRYDIYSAANKWELAAEVSRAFTEIVPSVAVGWIHLAYSLHVLKRTQEAWNVLLPVVDKFPTEYIMRYNLACYACQLGDLKAAYQWLEKAIDLADKTEIRTMALDDPDLEPLWKEIAEI